MRAAAKKEWLPKLKSKKNAEKSQKLAPLNTSLIEDRSQKRLASGAKKQKDAEKSQDLAHSAVS